MHAYKLMAHEIELAPQSKLRVTFDVIVAAAFVSFPNSAPHTISDEFGSSLSLWTSETLILSNFSSGKFMFNGITDTSYRMQ